MFKQLRIKIFNWLAAGNLTLKLEKEKNMGNSGYTLGTSGAGTNYGPLGITTSVPIHVSEPSINLKNSLNFTIARAQGGWIVQINKTHTITFSNNESSSSAELYIINEDADFDREIGKIITMSCLKKV